LSLSTCFHRYNTPAHPLTAAAAKDIITGELAVAKIAEAAKDLTNVVDLVVLKLRPGAWE